MPRRKQHYEEGDWFAVPLQGGGYALGLIARMKPNSSGLLGYFFGPRYSEIPKLAAAAQLHSTDAIERLIFGDLDLLERNWPVLGALPGWNRQQWPLPSFAGRDLVSGRPHIRTYDEDSLEMVSERWVRDADIAGLPQDGLFGAGAVVSRLSRVIQEQEQGISASAASR